MNIPIPASKLIDFIQSIEAPRGYGTIYGNNQAKLPKPLTAMTLDEVIKAQPNWTKRFGSSAAGGLQFMRATLLGLKKELGLTGRELFDEDFQERLGFHLLKRRGYEKFMAGQIDRTEFGKRLAQEWASFPVLAPTKGAHRQIRRGDTYYSGDKLNKALVKPEAIEALLDSVIRAERNRTSIVEKTVVEEKQVLADPEDLDRPVTKTKTFWTWIFTMLGAPAAAFAGLDWRVQIVIIAAILGLGFYAIMSRKRLADAVREIRSDIEGAA